MESYKTITLEEFRKEYFPKLKRCEFSKTIGFNNSFISKILSGKYECRKGKEYDRLKEYVKQYSNKMLISTNYIANEADKVEKVINNFKKEIKKRDEKIKDLENIIEDLLKSIWVIQKTKSCYKNGKFNYEQYKLKVKED